MFYEYACEILRDAYSTEDISEKIKGLKKAEKHFAETAHPEY